MILKQGIGASPGVAIGPALVLDTEEYRIPRRTIEPAQVAGQMRLLDAALDASRREVHELRAAAARKLGNQTAAIFSMHESLIADKKLRAAIAELIEKNHFSAAYAFTQEMKGRQRLFRDINDPYFKERVRDLYDIEKRVLRHILGQTRETIAKLTEPVIIIAHDLTPSQAITLDRDHVLGLIIQVGGQTSHTAIIARQLGIPAAVAVPDITTDVSGGETVIVDGTHGIVVINPTADIIEEKRGRQREYLALERELSGLRDLAAVTRDRAPITLLANIEIPEEARLTVESGAEGIGLYRTEFMFLLGPRVPTEEQQYETLRGVVRQMGDKPVVIRTFDLGSDKMIEALGPQADANPALGLRSLRYCLQHLDMFKAHLRAILRASAEGDVRIMFPMITTLLELRQAKSILGDVMEDLEEEDIPFRRDVPVGMMVETPAAALLSGAFVREVDFFSIGTNDLTQYTLAVDRSNERVAKLYSAHNPAVLRLIQEIVQAARRTRVTVSLCGEMAGTPLYCELLIGLGLRQLSMAPKDIPEIKKIVRSTTLRRCRAVARRALRLDADQHVLNFLRDETRKIMPEAV